METHKINGSMSRKELAEKYKMSTKTFAARLEKNGLYFGPVKALLPIQIMEIINVLGYWEYTVNDP